MVSESDCLDTYRNSMEHAEKDPIWRTEIGGNDDNFRIVATDDEKAACFVATS
jgi:hypothetical protein